MRLFRAENQPRPWKAFLIVASIALGAGLYWARKIERSTRQVEDALTTALSKAFRPQVDVKRTVLSALGDIQKQSKWVVLTTHIDVAITRESRKTILWEMLDLGTTTVSVMVPDNRVQYVIDLQGVKPESFSFDGKSLVLALPAPRVDEDIVEVQSDPSKVNVHTEVGWARLKSRSGERLRQQALSELRSVVLEQARAEPLLLQAQTQADLEMKKLLQTLTPQLRDDVTLSVRFQRP